MGKKDAKRLGCCERFRSKPGKVCKACPLFATLKKKDRRKLLEKYR